MANNLIYQYFLPYTGPSSVSDIITPTSSGMPSWAEIGVKSAKKYAEAIGVEYMFCDEVTVNAPNQNLESTRVFLDPLFDKYDKILVLDVDTTVSTTKSIFDIEIEDIAMVAEGGRGCPIGFINDKVSQLEKYGNIKFPNSKTFANTKRYLNGGVVVWSKQGRLKARQRFGGLPEMFRYREALKMNEQPYLNLMINLHDIHVTELDTMWNRMNYMWPFGVPDGYINHFLAVSKRMMKDYR